MKGPPAGKNLKRCGKGVYIPGSTGMPSGAIAMILWQIGSSVKFYPEI